jgi:transcriptional regulator with XRE-family HTH domain
MRNLHDVAVQFRMLRQTAGKTQMEVARIVEMRPEALSRFECGHATDFSLVKLLRLMNVLEKELKFVNIAQRPTLEDVLEERLRNANVGPQSR